MLWAHEHSYERLWPLYDRQVRYHNLPSEFAINAHSFNLASNAASFVCCRFAMDHGKSHIPTLVPQFM